MIARYNYFADIYNVIKLLVSILTKKYMTSKFSVLYYHILNFTAFVIAFADNAMHVCIK